MRFPVNRNLPLAALVLLAACGGRSHVDSASWTPHAPASGPAADYPVVLGEPFLIDGVTYTPTDRMNYDAVGRATIAGEGNGAVSGAHRTLPLPSYAEVTSLETGRTILVRIERRGPMSGNTLIELSAGAAAQLGAAGNVPVRVRRVNPPEAERALLRSGQQAPARMDTPKSLVAVLARRLEQQEGARQPAPQITPAAIGEAVQVPSPAPQAAQPAQPKPQPQPQPSRPAASGAFVIQIGAFSDKARAEKAAARSGGVVSPAGKLWRVRIGPFATQAQADAALAKARAAGNSEARVQRAN